MTPKRSLSSFLLTVNIPTFTCSLHQTDSFLHQVFGWEFTNTRLLADEYAKAGFYAYIPDVHEGDSLPISFLNNVEPNLKDQEKLSVADKAKNAALIPATLGPWLAKHREGVSKPIIDGFINTVRMTPGTNKIGAIGFCWFVHLGVKPSFLMPNSELQDMVREQKPLSTPETCLVTRNFAFERQR